MPEPITDELILRALRGDATDAEQRQVAIWRQASPDAEARYQEVRRVWELTSPLVLLLRAGPVPAADTLLERAADAEPEVDTPQSGSARRTGRAWLRWAAAIAAVLLLVLIPLQIPWGRNRSGDLVAAVYATGPHELLSVPLGDGSVVRLAPSSTLRVTGDAASRDVWLDGRAYFSVAKQDGRRFRVRTALGQAVVLGTRFDLRAQDGELHLVVVEGRVALSAGNDEVPVEAGQVSGVIAGRITPAVSIPDARAEVDWIGHFLVFDGTPLLSAASELARVYGVAIRIEAPALEARTITGWFSDQTYDEVVTAVCRVVKARCTVADSVVLIGQ